MPDEIEDAVNTAVRDESVKVIVLRGAGRAFCAGWNFGGGFEYGAKLFSTDGQWDPGKDMMHTTAMATSPHQKFMSIWRSPKPVIAQVHGWCVGGGSDYALCADLVIASEDAQIGTPYSRVWGAYLSGMWIYRLGLTRAKYHALTGKPLSGRQAADVGLINQAVPFDQLEAVVAAQADELASLPMGQLAAQKLMVNQVYENMGLASTQTLGAILDGIMRNIPEAHAFIDRAAQDPASAFAERDRPFGDYSQAPGSGKPDPGNVIKP
jgi:enoyl-CoA hydratase